MSCGVGHRCSSDLVLLWLWHRPAAVAPVQPLAWESAYAAGAALKRPKKVRACVCVCVLSVNDLTLFFFSEYP